MKKAAVSIIAILLLVLLLSFLSAFAEEASEPESVYRLPLSLLEIEEEAFFGTAAETVILPVGFLRIEENAFDEACHLTDVYIPETTEYIDNSAFCITPDLIIHGIDNSYAEDWAHEHEIPFVVDDIWTKVEKSGWSPTVRIIRTNLYIATIVLIIMFELFKFGYYEVRSRRPQDRPDLYPIEYRFP